MIGKLKIAANRISQIINNGCGFPRIRRFFGIKAGEKLSPLPHDCVNISDAVQIPQPDIFVKLAEESRCNREIFENSLRKIVN